jgi:hypothetical protein
VREPAVPSGSRMVWRHALLCGLAGATACGGAPAPNASGSPPQSSPIAPAPPRVVLLPIARAPDIELREKGWADVGDSHVAFDGIAEGLAWPSLDKALGPRLRGQVVTIQAARSVHVIDLLRAAWTARSNDVRVQTPDEGGLLRAVQFEAKRPDRAPEGGCHLAVFVRPDGSLRVAAPGGPRELGADRPGETLAHSLEVERATCRIKYVAFGAESDDTSWGSVFDLIVAVDRARSAGDARYVLGQAMHRR